MRRRGLRQQRGWTQADLARNLCEVGLSWTPNRVAQIETLRGRVTLGEALALSKFFAVPIDDLATYRPPLVPPAPTPSEFPTPAALNAEQSRKAAKRLGLTSRELDLLCEQRYGRPFVAERAARWEGAPTGPKRSVQAWRSHITRGLMAELRRPADEPEEASRTS